MMYTRISQQNIIRPLCSPFLISIQYWKDDYKLRRNYKLVVSLTSCARTHFGFVEAPDQWSTPMTPAQELPPFIISQLILLPHGPTPHCNELCVALELSLLPCAYYATLRCCRTRPSSILRNRPLYGLSLACCGGGITDRYVVRRAEQPSLYWVVREFKIANMYYQFKFFIMCNTHYINIMHNL